jgi:hypothetical protein
MNIKKYASVASAYLMGIINEELIDLLVWSLMDLSKGLYSSGPPGQYPFLSLSFSSYKQQDI